MATSAFREKIDKRKGEAYSQNFALRPEDV
jgi:hypothetical protein